MLPAILAAWVCASVDPPRILLRLEQGAAVLGRDHAAQLELRAEGVEASQALPRFSSNVGKVGPARREASGVFRATFQLPDDAVPAIGVVLAALQTPDGVHYAAARIKLFAEAEVMLRTAPGAQVQLWALGHHHGPTVTDATGRVRFSVKTLTPDFAYRYRIKVTGAQPVERSERVTPVGPLSRMAVGPMAEPGVLGPGDTFAFAAAAATEDGRRAPPETIRCGIAGGEMTSAARLMPDLAVFELTVPPEVVESEVAVRCRTADGAVAQRSIVLKERSPPARLALYAPATYRAGDAAPRVLVEALAEDGSVTALPRDLEIRATLSSATGPRELPLTAARHARRHAVDAVIPIPSHFAGASAVRVTVSAHRGALQQEKQIQLQGAEPVALRVAGRSGPVLASGRETLTLSVALVDRYGNVTQGEFEATAARGSVQRSGGHAVEYSSPFSTESATDTVTVRSGDLERVHGIKLTAPKIVALEAGAGALVTEHGGVAPAVVLNAVYVHERHIGMLSLGAADGLAARRGKVVGGEAVTVHSDWRVVTGTGKGVYSFAVTPLLALHLGLGLGATLFATELEALTGDQVARPRAERWAASLHVAAASGVVLDLGRWGVAANVDLAYAVPADGRSPLLTALASVALSSRWGW